jgi:hypothetical protein
MNNTVLKPAEITSSGIFRGAPVSGRFDAFLTAPHIIDAEREYFEPIVGAAMWQDMIDKRGSANCNYNTAIGTVVPAFPDDPNYETFWEMHAFEFISLAVYWFAIPYIQTQMHSGGAVNINDQFHRSATVQQIDRLQNQTGDTLSKRAYAITQWLCDNENDYPLFTNTSCNSGCTDSNQNLRRNGIIIY